MAITKDKKKALLSEYVTELKNAGCTYVINQNAIPVNVATSMRKEMTWTNAKMSVVRKRIFLKAVQEAGLETVDLKNLEGSTVAIFTQGAEDFSPLKVVKKFNQSFKSASNDKSIFGFLGGWSNKQWKDAQYVTELASIPSKEELISKFLYLLKYPVQSFACVIDQMAKKSV